MTHPYNTNTQINTPQTMMLWLNETNEALSYDWKSKSQLSLPIQRTKKPTTTVCNETFISQGQQL